jgi:hypothetical protein
MLTRDAHNILDVPTIIWFGVLPDPTGVKKILRTARYGQVVEKWFSPVTTRDLRPSFKNRLATYFIVVMARLLGASVPWPELLGLDQSAVVAHWAAETSREHGACLVLTHVSKALRVCIAAQREGLDLTGVTFMGGGESPTPAKVREITRSGACYVPTYFCDEAGAIGLGCVRPTDVNDLHFLKDGLALIQYPHQVPSTEITVDAFYFTTLLTSAPKLMLNAENDDYGIIEPSACGCPLERFGFTEHLRCIRSFRKLTGEGVTLVGSEMVHILQEVLPGRFGGSPLDYQLLEEEEKGFTRLSLLVSPRIEIADEAAVVEAVLEALGRRSVAADLARAIWSQARTLRVKRVEPIWTVRGKLMPLYLARRSAHPSDASTGTESVP